MENETLFVTTDDDFKDINNILKELIKINILQRTLKKEKR